MEWNDLRDEVGSCVGSYDNPPDLSEQSWSVMKFRELHALQRSGLPEGLPVAGRDHPVRQRHRRFPGRELHWLRLLRHRLPVRRPAHFQEGPQGLQVHAVLGPRGGGPGAGLREDLPDRCDHLRQQAGDDRACRRPRRGPQITRLRERRPV
ncbi:hypothetical protein G6F31_018269 [Rhizopus arrhizus]|nr:hypothetical protein G6F31_018269 [Rhizopus arrhizus]